MRPGRLSYWLLIALPLVLLTAVACNRSAEPQSVYQKGKDRVPKDEGVVTDVNFERLTLDRDRTYQISEEVESFSSYNGEVMPLLHHKNHYAQIGVHEGKVVSWIAGIGLVLEDGFVVYNGTVKSADKKRLVFEDGTVLQMSVRAYIPEKGERVKATILPAKHQVVDVVQQ